MNIQMLSGEKENLIVLMSTLPVVCRRAHVLFTCFVFVCATPIATFHYMFVDFFSSWLYDLLFDFWCLTPLSAIFQLYHGDQF